MAHNTSSLPRSTSPTNQILSETSFNVPIAPPPPPSVSGSHDFYLIIALAVLIRAIVNPPNSSPK